MLRVLVNPACVLIPCGCGFLICLVHEFPVTCARVILKNVLGNERYAFGGCYIGGSFHSYKPT